MKVPLNTSSQQSHSRLNYFTDREKAIAAFDALWQDDNHPFLTFNGLSGIGKSTLIDFLIDTRCKPQKIPYALIDFEGNTGSPLRTSWRTLISELAVQLDLHRHPAFVNAFEKAETRFQFVKQRLKVKINQSANNGGQITQSPIIVNIDMATVLRQIDEQARYQTGTGFIEAMEATYHNNLIALFFDSCELLEHSGDKSLNRWLWQWLKAAVDRLHGLRVIIAGRNKFAGIPTRYRKQTSLEPFSAGDSDRLLEHLGVTDPKWRSAVYSNLAHGHPLITEMAGNLWQEAKKAGSQIAINDIPTLSEHEKAVEWLTSRILERLNQPLKDIVRWGTLLRRFNQDILVHTLPKSVSAINDEIYEQLRQYSFVVPARKGNGLACHDLLRQVQNAYLRTHKPDAYREFHTKAALYFFKQNDLVETLYHRLMSGDDRAPQDWYKAVHAAYLSQDWNLWASLLDAAESPEQRPTFHHKADVCFWRGQWHRGRYENKEALDSYQKALKLFREVGDRLGEANTLKAIGDVQRFKDNYKEALDSYQKALKLFREVGDRLGEANTLQAIGFMLLDSGDSKTGLNILNVALSLYISIGNKVGQVNIHWGLGIRNKIEGNLQKAEFHVAHTLEMVEQFIPDHPFTTTVKDTLIQIRKEQNQLSSKNQRKQD